MTENAFTVAVIGAGHAGCEAVRAAAALGERVVLITSRPETIGQMSCNPAIGGVAKGQLVREIDALGGLMARATDSASIQFRMLNTSKGPAVRSPRSQSDRRRYVQAMRSLVELLPNVTVHRANATAIEVAAGRVRAVHTDRGGPFEVGAVVLAAGTFLSGLIRVGEKQLPAGRAGDAASLSLADSLKSLGLPVMRFKTGTPPRIDGRSVDFSALTEQPGEGTAYRFSYFYDCTPLPQLSCWQTRTTERTRRLVLDNLGRSSLYGGYVKGKGPRYCPSLEDKFVKFPDRTVQHLFLEPEGLDTDEMYLNGLSNSLPLEIQVELVRSVEGLSRGEILKPGYAIEYDCYDPRELTLGLQSRNIRGLFLAGQVNGTSGYEEAAGQGLAAGLNAARLVREQEEITFDRTNSYLGVLIDDIVTRGADEPYRLFSSRAEYRLSLRQDNADLRLSPLAHEVGLLPDEFFERIEKKRDQIQKVVETTRSTRVGAERINPFLERIGSARTGAALTVEKILRRPEVKVRELFDFLDGEFAGLADEVISQVEMETKYAGYLQRESSRVVEAERSEKVHIPPSLDYAKLSGLSTESRERLARHRPATLGQASRIPGLRPGDIIALMVELSRLGQPKTPAGD